MAPTAVDDAPLIDPTGVPSWRWSVPNAPPPPPTIRRGPPPDRRLSDALTKLIAPYICWPPSTSELDHLLSTLCFGAEVWNITLTTLDPVDRHHKLDQLVSAHFSPEDHPQTFEIAQEIVERKQMLFTDDNRLIVNIHLTCQSGCPVVFVTGASWR